MKNDCTKWKDQLLEAALTKTATGDLHDHVLKCADCADELAALRARRERLDALLPLVAQGAKPSAQFRSRVLAAAASASEAKHRQLRRVWRLAGAITLATATLLIGLMLRRSAVQIVPESELAGAEKLAEWRAPSDVLLETPGRENLRTTPRLGESYLHIPVKTDEEE